MLSYPWSRETAPTAMANFVIAFAGGRGALMISWFFGSCANTVFVFYDYSSFADVLCSSGPRSARAGPVEASDQLAAGHDVSKLDRLFARDVAFLAGLMVQRAFHRRRTWTRTPPFMLHLYAAREKERWLSCEEGARRKARYSRNIVVRAHSQNCTGRRVRSFASNLPAIIRSIPVSRAHRP